LLVFIEGSGSDSYLFPNFPPFLYLYVTMKPTLTTLLLLISLALHAQVDRDSPLFHAMQEQDSTFFERSFNRCDIEYLEEHIAADLKFFHDQGGFQDRDTFFQNVKNNLCGGGPQKPIRKVDTNSLAVFPLYQNGQLYGAIQHGIHHFYLREAGKEDLWTSTAKFTHVWILVGETWKLSEVLSYDHQSGNQP
jgi:hypothetical protein